MSRKNIPEDIEQNTENINLLQKDGKISVVRRNSDEKVEMLPFHLRNTFLRHLIKDWRRWWVLVAPIIFTFIPVMLPYREARCAYVILMIACFYSTEALPLPVIALIPVFAFPLLGIVSTNQICMCYMRNASMMFFGGQVVSVAMVHSKLAKRIALFAILKVGQTPRRLMLGFHFTTMFLSMWIANPAATTMMVRILDAVLQEMYKSDSLTTKREENYLKEDTRVAPMNQSQLELVEMNENQIRMKNDRIRASQEIITANIYTQEYPIKIEVAKEPGKEEHFNPPNKESEALRPMFYLATTYGANIGGTGFLSGAGPNLVLWSVLQNSFPGGTDLNFGNWMLFTIPAMLLCGVAAWLWLEFVFIGVGKWRRLPKSTPEKEKAVRRLLEWHYDQLGMINFHEMTVIAMLGILFLLWVLRAPEMYTGWGELVDSASAPEIQIGGATPAILIVFLLFWLPSKNPRNDDTHERNPSALNWKVVHEKVPWGILLVMGGGIAMAEGASESGLTTFFRSQVQHLQVYPQPVIILLVCLIATFLTELVSNTTAASMLVPALKELALGIRMNPLYLMLPGTICCSYGFTLPVANPSNAFIFNSFPMNISDFIKGGSLLNFLCVLIMTGLITTYGVLIFDLNTFPEWAEPAIANATAAVL